MFVNKRLSLCLVIMIVMAIAPLHAVWVINKPCVILRNPDPRHLREKMLSKKLLLGDCVQLVEPKEDEVLEFGPDEQLICFKLYDRQGNVCSETRGIVKKQDLLEIKKDLLKLRNLVVSSKKAIIRTGNETLTLYKRTKIYGKKINEEWCEVYLVNGLEGLVKASDVR